MGWVRTVGGILLDASGLCGLLGLPQDFGTWYRCVQSVGATCPLDWSMIGRLPAMDAGTGWNLLLLIVGTALLIPTASWRKLWPSHAAGATTPVTQSVKTENQSGAKNQLAGRDINNTTINQASPSEPPKTAAPDTGFLESVVRGLMDRRDDWEGVQTRYAAFLASRPGSIHSRVFHLERGRHLAEVKAWRTGTYNQMRPLGQTEADAFHRTHGATDLEKLDNQKARLDLVIQRYQDRLYQLRLAALDPVTRNLLAQAAHDREAKQNDPLALPKRERLE
jgi:hypothetical protein